jgi:hypothetical protein
MVYGNVSDWTWHAYAVDGVGTVDVYAYRNVVDGPKFTTPIITYPELK